MRIRDQVALSVVMVFAFTGSAYAYLDPGTGSLIVQGAIAAVGAVLLAGKMYWARIRMMFGKAHGVEEGSDSTWDDGGSSTDRHHTSSE